MMRPARDPPQPGNGGTRPAPALPPPATAALGALLTQRGLKHSRQREWIAQIFFSLQRHVSVEELLVHARKVDRRVSPATVYRTMKLLVEGGLATAREFGDGQARYEVAAGRPHHDHLVCTGCGEIVEFRNPKIEALQAAVARGHGFQVERRRLELYGQCARCGEKRREGGRP